MQCNTASLWAQNQPEDVALEKDDFQDSFFESLKQKGIENYDKAIIELEKCLKIQPNNATIYFELGKNYLEQKEYKKSYESFEKATKLDPTNRWFWAGMYDVCFETKEFEKAIPIVLKLIEFKKEYKEDLVSLYMNTNQFDNALDLINELNDQVGKLEIRTLYKAQILEDPKYHSSERINLLEQIKKNPKEESNYVALIFLYNKQNQEVLAQEIAKKLEVEIPNSDWAKVSLFKSYLIDSARYLCSFNSNRQGGTDNFPSHLQNINLVYTNRQSISGTYNFSFHGISGDDEHNSPVNLAITISFVKFKHKCLIN